MSTESLPMYRPGALIWDPDGYYRERIGSSIVGRYFGSARTDRVSGRAAYQALAEYVAQGRNGYDRPSGLGRHTRIEYADDTDQGRAVRVRCYSTPVATFYPDGRAVVRFDGWYTQTTARVLNAVLPFGYTVSGVSFTTLERFPYSTDRPVYLIGGTSEAAPEPCGGAFVIGPRGAVLPAPADRLHGTRWRCEPGGRPIRFESWADFERYRNRLAYQERKRRKIAQQEHDMRYAISRLQTRDRDPFEDMLARTVSDQRKRFEDQNGPGLWARLYDAARADLEAEHLETGAPREPFERFLAWKLLRRDGAGRIVSAHDAAGGMSQAPAWELGIWRDDSAKFRGHCVGLNASPAIAQAAHYVQPDRAGTVLALAQYAGPFTGGPAVESDKYTARMMRLLAIWDIRTDQGPDGC